MRMDDFVAEIVTDPSNPPQLAVLEGFIGTAGQAEDIRLYFDESLSSYIDIPSGDVRYSIELPANISALGGSKLWVDQNSRIFGPPEVQEAAEATETKLRPDLPKTLMLRTCRPGFCEPPTFLNPCRTTTFFCPPHTARVRCRTFEMPCRTVNLACPTNIAARCPIDLQDKLDPGVTNACDAERGAFNERVERPRRSIDLPCKSSDIPCRTPDYPCRTENCRTTWCDALMGAEARPIRSEDLACRTVDLPCPKNANAADFAPQANVQGPGILPTEWCKTWNRTCEIPCNQPTDWGRTCQFPRTCDCPIPTNSERTCVVCPQPTETGRTCFCPQPTIRERTCAACDFNLQGGLGRSARLCTDAGRSCSFCVTDGGWPRSCAVCPTDVGPRCNRGDFGPGDFEDPFGFDPFGR
jgi:hypothetical protein